MGKNNDVKARAHEDGLCPDPTKSNKANKYVTLTADVMFVNSLPFVVTFGQGIGLLTAEFTTTQTAKQLACNLNQIVSINS